MNVAVKRKFLIFLPGIFEIFLTRIESESSQKFLLLGVGGGLGKDSCHHHIYNL